MCIFGAVILVLQSVYILLFMSDLPNRVLNWFKNAGKEIWAFLSSWYFLKNLLYISALMTALLLLTFWWMRCYTNHGNTLQVDDYVGMQLEEVIEKAKSKSFQIVVSDSVFQVGATPHTVLEQNPDAFSRVKKNRKIYLRVTKKTPDLVTLPDLTGGNDDFKAYDRKLQRRGVKTKIVRRKFSNKLEVNTILEVLYKGEDVTSQLKDGVEVEMGSTVEFVVTERRGGTVQIPNLVCKKVDAATFLVQNYNLSIGSVVADATVTDQNSAYVWRQVPRYSSSGSMRIGEQIDLYITQYKPDNCGGNPANIEAPPEKPTTKKVPDTSEEF